MTRPVPVQPPRPWWLNEATELSLKRRLAKRAREKGPGGLYDKIRMQQSAVLRLELNVLWLESYTWGDVTKALFRRIPRARRERSAGTLIREALGSDGALRWSDTELYCHSGGAELHRYNDEWHIVLSKLVPVEARTFAALHQLGHWALGVDNGHHEATCDFFAAECMRVLGFTDHPAVKLLKKGEVWKAPTALDAVAAEVAMKGRTCRVPAGRTPKGDRP